MRKDDKNEENDDYLLLQICCQDRQEGAADIHISLDLELVLDKENGAIKE